MSSFRLAKATFGATLAIFTVASAQDATIPPGGDTLYFNTKVGSFKMLAGSPVAPPVGRLEVDFTGTLLVTGLDGHLTVSGKLQKEYENAPHKRVAYHGTGKVVVDGAFTSAQWFGRDMAASFKGRAIVRLYGEFDQDLKTGTYWYGSEVDKKHDWGTFGRRVDIPIAVKAAPVAPKVRVGGK